MAHAVLVNIVCGHRVARERGPIDETYSVSFSRQQHRRRRSCTSRAHNYNVVQRCDPLFICVITEVTIRKSDMDCPKGFFGSLVGKDALPGRQSPTPCRLHDPYADSQTRISNCLPRQIEEFREDMAHPARARRNTVAGNTRKASSSGCL